MLISVRFIKCYVECRSTFCSTNTLQMNEKTIAEEENSGCTPV